ncbi:ser/thr protein kinase, putative [Theileria annulata]|uniref:Ser/thr protein kinase, putative n=1 Tax=Theileria annulata TaxID=5874 RepID=Q4UEY6_THEAN|nr:ser/thr protein kinase, putative [Theileria annulata]CAI74353.1 ser/thr protein kinase, putative [Theileria annulata]|eukprot:XP_952085.1 ser/thr protein kinase, putative [Theileria annulata]
MSGLETIKLLHYGKCNDIFLAKDSKGNQFALKRFYREELEKRKEYINRDGKLVKKDWFEDFKRALEVQKVLDNESCIKLHGIFGIDFSPEKPTFEDEIDLVFEYAEFGSLMSLESFQEEVPNFPKEVIKCITKDVLNALLYRDFGESEFMTEDGKVKGSRGTYYFLAPEVLEINSSTLSIPDSFEIVELWIIDENDGNAIDMWALGITLWILYFRNFPFYGNSGSIYETITNIQNFNFKTQIQTLKPNNSHEKLEDEDEFVDLLEKILEKDPKKRIKPKEALNHNWLRNVDYEAAREYCRRNIKK